MIAKLLAAKYHLRRRARRLAVRVSRTLHWPAARVFRENFAAPVVKVQAARHHRVISSGPYAFVRHPMYSGIMPFFVGVPLLLLGSWWGVVIAPVFAIRARIEERALVEGLPD